MTEVDSEKEVDSEALSASLTAHLRERLTPPDPPPMPEGLSVGERLLWSYLAMLGGMWAHNVRLVEWRPGVPSPARTSVDALLRHGRAWRADARHLRRLPRGLRRGVSGRCYENAGRAAVASAAGEGRYLYCEGVGLSVVPLWHAWLVDKETGLALDPTWRARFRTPDGRWHETRTDAERCVYWGVALEFDGLRRMLLRRERWGLFADHGLLLPGDWEDVESHAWRGGL